eukprot:scaffold32263_cov129-Isochrysis_galbana.AAC.5
MACRPTGQTRGRPCAPVHSSRLAAPAPGAPCGRRQTRPPAPAPSLAGRRPRAGSRRTPTGTTPSTEARTRSASKLGWSVHWGGGG